MALPLAIANAKGRLSTNNKQRAPKLARLRTRCLAARSRASPSRQRMLALPETYMARIADHDCSPNSSWGTSLKALAHWWMYPGWSSSKPPSEWLASGTFSSPGHLKAESLARVWPSTLNLHFSEHRPTVATRLKSSHREETPNPKSDASEART